MVYPQTADLPLPLAAQFLVDQRIIAVATVDLRVDLGRERQRMVNEAKRVIDFVTASQAETQCEQRAGRGDITVIDFVTASQAETP
jgi:hypothetical protein